MLACTSARLGALIGETTWPRSHDVSADVNPGDRFDPSTGSPCTTALSDRGKPADGSNRPPSARGMLLGSRLQPTLQYRRDGVGKVVYLDDEVAEPGADLHGPVGWPVHQLERDDPLAGNLSTVSVAPPPRLMRPTSW